MCNVGYFLPTCPLPLPTCSSSPSSHPHTLPPPGYYTSWLLSLLSTSLRGYIACDCMRSVCTHVYIHPHPTPTFKSNQPLIEHTPHLSVNRERVRNYKGVFLFFPLLFLSFSSVFAEGLRGKLRWQRVGWLPWGWGGEGGGLPLTPHKNQCPCMLATVCVKH